MEKEIVRYFGENQKAHWSMRVKISRYEDVVPRTTSYAEYHSFDESYHTVESVFGEMNCVPLYDISGGLLGHGWCIEIDLRNFYNRAMTLYFVTNRNHPWLATHWHVFCEGHWAFFYDVFGDGGLVWQGK